MTWDLLARHAKSLTYEHGSGKLPRHHVWRPYRLIDNGELLAVTAIQHSKWYNCLNVDVFLTAMDTAYSPNEITRALLLFLLSDAFKSGGTMQLLFSRHVHGGRVPDAVIALAHQVGIELTQTHLGIVTPEESIKLYLALSGLSNESQHTLQSLNDAGLVSIPRVCYMLLHEIWSQGELERLLLSGPFPELILNNNFSPLFRHLNQYVVEHLRLAVMGGMLERVLRAREFRDEQGRVYSNDDRRWKVNITYNSIYDATVCQSDEYEPINVFNWPINDLWQPLLPRGRLIALLRARDIQRQMLNLANDIAAAATIKQNEPEATVALIVPFDFWLLAPSVQDNAKRNAESQGVALGVCPDTVSALDAEGRRRLVRCKAVRQ